MDLFSSSGFCRFVDIVEVLILSNIVDGSGGCDGCLNWSGVGVRYPSASSIKYKFLYPDVNETNNNGMEYALVILEELYTNPI